MTIASLVNEMENGVVQFKRSVFVLLFPGENVYQVFDEGDEDRVFNYFDDALDAITPLLRHNPYLRISQIDVTITDNILKEK